MSYKDASYINWRSKTAATPWATCCLSACQKHCTSARARKQPLLPHRSTARVSSLGGTALQRERIAPSCRLEPLLDA